MDHDAMLKDVTGLKNFRARAEKAISFIEGLQAAGFKTPEGGGEESVAAEFEKFRSDTDDRLKKIEQNFTDWSGRLDQLSNAPQAAVGTPMDEGLQTRLEEMLTWFDANREGLEILLSLDGEPDQPEDGQPQPDILLATGSTDSAKPALDGSQSSTDAPNPQTGTDTGPGSIDGPSGISQDPSADASIATDQPAAKPE
jgi:hypothetical protein